MHAQTPGTLYSLHVTTAVSSGMGTAGVAFFGANGTKVVYAPAMDLQATNATAHTLRIRAPPNVLAASVYIGKFDGSEGHIEVCS